MNNLDESLYWGILEEQELLYEFIDGSWRFRVLLDKERELIEMQQYNYRGKTWCWSDEIKECDNKYIYDLIIHLIGEKNV